MEETKYLGSGDEGEIYLDVKSKELCLQTATANTDLNSGSITNIKYRYPKEYSGTVRVAKSPDDIENVIQMLEAIRDSGCPTGLILYPTQVSVYSDKVSKQDNKVLGFGKTSEIIVVKDSKLGVDSAKKTIRLSHFHGDQIRAWIHLGKQDMSPKLSSFKLNDDKVVMLMEIIEGKTLQEVLCHELLQNPSHAVSLSFFVLDGLLSAYNALKEEKFTHGDMHAGNVMVAPSITIKLLDFDCARKLLQTNSKSVENYNFRIKNDLIEIIRMFCNLYSGYDLGGKYKAENLLKTLKEASEYDLKERYEAEKIFKSLKEELSSQMRKDLSEAQREELFKVLLMLIDCISDPKQEGYGDTSKVSKYIKDNFSNDSVKRELAVKLFSEHIQHKNAADHGMEYEMETSNVCDDPDKDECVEKNSTAENLKNFGVVQKIAS